MRSDKRSGVRTAKLLTFCAAAGDPSLLLAAFRARPPPAPTDYLCGAGKSAERGQVYK